MNKSLEIMQEMTEQDWYADVVPLATRLQSHLVGKSGGSFFVTKKELLRDFPDEEPEALEMAIEILRSNAAIFPVQGTDTFRINWQRLSGALL